jgi:hypothetical protein
MQLFTFNFLSDAECDALPKEEKFAYLRSVREAKTLLDELMANQLARRARKRRITSSAGSALAQSKKRQESDDDDDCADDVDDAVHGMAFSRALEKRIAVPHATRLLQLWLYALPRGRSVRQHAQKSWAVRQRVALHKAGNSVERVTQEQMALAAPQVDQASP